MRGLTPTPRVRITVDTPAQQSPGCWRSQMVLGKERSRGICPTPVPWPWVALTCGPIRKKGFARGSGQRSSVWHAGQEGRRQPRGWGSHSAGPRVWPQLRCSCGGDSSAQMVRPGQDGACPGIHRAAVLQLCSVLHPGACPGRGPRGLPSPDSVPWRPSSASAMFTPKTGLPWAQLRSHHLEFKITFSTVCWDS